VLIIDRFEGDWAVIEYGEIVFNLPRSLVPRTAKEGDVLRLELTVDEKATRERRQHIEELTKDLFARRPPQKT